MNSSSTGDPITLKTHSGGMMFVMCANSAGRCGRGRVSTRKATLVGS
jgi:hypothetical protein